MSDRIVKPSCCNRDSLMSTLKMVHGKAICPSCRENNARVNLERRIVRTLFLELATYGWRTVSVFDGQETIKTVSTKNAIDAVFSVDESRITFGNAEYRHNVLIVLGNGHDVIADWSYDRGDADGFDAAMDAITETIERKYPE